MDVKGTTLYLLDTNTFAYIVNGRSPAARARMTSLIEHSPLAISAITEGEILYGLAKKPEAMRLRAAVESLLATVLVLPWDSAAASAYGTLRAQLSSAGKILSSMDMLIAAHAIASDAILVTSDKAFAQVEALRPVANWATDLTGEK